MNPIPAQPARRAVGIVRQDISGPAAQGAAAGIAALLHAHRVVLDQIQFPASPAAVGRLLARLPGAVTTLVVPSEAHLGGGWLTAARQHTDVWSLQGIYWPKGQGHCRKLWRPPIPHRDPGTTWRVLTGDTLTLDATDPGTDRRAGWPASRPQQLSLGAGAR